MPATVVVLALPDRMQFLIVLLVAPLLTEALAIQMAALARASIVINNGQVAYVPPLFEPSIVTKSVPFSLMTVVVAVMVTLWPLAGLIVTVFVELAPGNSVEDEREGFTSAVGRVSQVDRDRTAYADVIQFVDCLGKVVKSPAGTDVVASSQRRLDRDRACDFVVAPAPCRFPTRPSP